MLGKDDYSIIADFVKERLGERMGIEILDLYNNYKIPHKEHIERILGNLAHRTNNSLSELIGQYLSHFHDIQYEMPTEDTVILRFYDRIRETDVINHRYSNMIQYVVPTVSSLIKDTKVIYA